MTTRRADVRAFASLSHARSLDAVLDILLDGWGEDYTDGRTLLLKRLRSFRRDRGPDTLRTTAEAIYRSLITFGEETGDMRFVHLAVECRDVLIYEG